MWLNEYDRYFCKIGEINERSFSKPTPGKFPYESAPDNYRYGVESYFLLGNIYM